MKFSGTTNLQKGSYLKRHNKLETLLFATSEEIKQKKSYNKWYIPYGLGC